MTPQPDQLTLNSVGALWDEQRYRALFELGPVAVYSCDSAGVIQEFNRRAVELWGVEPKIGDTDKRFCGSFKLFRPDAPTCRTNSVRWRKWWPAHCLRLSTAKCSCFDHYLAKPVDPAALASTVKALVAIGNRE